MSVAKYYRKPKMLWDELLCLAPMPKAYHECEASKELVSMMFSS